MPVSGTSRIAAFVATALLIGGAAARTIEPVSNFEDMPIRVAMTVSQVREAEDPAQLRSYLDRYPSGIFAPLARSRLAGIEK